MYVSVRQFQYVSVVLVKNHKLGEQKVRRHPSLTYCIEQRCQGWRLRLFVILQQTTLVQHMKRQRQA